MTREVLEMNVTINDYCKRIREADNRYDAGDLKREAWEISYKTTKQLRQLGNIKTYELWDFWQRKLEQAMVEGYFYTSKEAWVFGKKESKRYDGHRYSKDFFSHYSDLGLDFDEY